MAEKLFRQGTERKLKPGHLSPFFVPWGLSDNSPAVYCRGAGMPIFFSPQSPVGMVENGESRFNRPAGTDWCSVLLSHSDESLGYYQTDPTGRNRCTGRYFRGFRVSLHAAPFRR